MALDFSEAREIVEAAKKRGLIRPQGEDLPLAEPEKTGEGGAVLPDWLQAGIAKPPARE